MDKKKETSQRNATHLANRCDNSQFINKTHSADQKSNISSTKNKQWILSEKETHQSKFVPSNKKTNNTKMICLDHRKQQVKRKQRKTCDPELIKLKKEHMEAIKIMNEISNISNGTQKVSENDKTTSASCINEINNKNNSNKHSEDETCFKDKMKPNVDNESSCITFSPKKKTLFEDEKDEIQLREEDETFFIPSNNIEKDVAFDTKGVSMHAIKNLQQIKTEGKCIEHHHEKQAHDSDIIVHIGMQKSKIDCCEAVVSNQELLGSQEQHHFETHKDSARNESLDYVSCSSSLSGRFVHVEDGNTQKNEENSLNTMFMTECNIEKGKTNLSCMESTEHKSNELNESYLHTTKETKDFKHEDDNFCNYDDDFMDDECNSIEIQHEDNSSNKLCSQYQDVINEKIDNGKSSIVCSSAIEQIEDNAQNHLSKTEVRRESEVYSSDEDFYR